MSNNSKSSRLIPGIMLLTIKLDTESSIKYLMNLIETPWKFWIPISCRAICAFSCLRMAMLPTVPLHVTTKSPLYTTVFGKPVQRFIVIDPRLILLEPVIYGVPSF